MVRMLKLIYLNYGQHMAYVNGLRANLPFGYMDTAYATYTSTSDCKLVTCSASAGLIEESFEPNALYKGIVINIK